MRATKPDARVVKLAADQVNAKGLRAAAHYYGLDERTMRRLADGQAVAPGTIEQIKPKVRTADEFEQAKPAFSPPVRNFAALSWPLADIRTARDNQLIGNFHLPVRLAEAMRTDDALYVAYHNRIAPQSAVNATLTPASGARGVAVCNRALGSCHVSRSVLSGINGTMANHGLAIGYNLHEPNSMGTRVDFRHIEWPLEFVRWRSTDNTLWTSTREGVQVPINHGDGRWTVYRKFYDRPWLQEAAIIPGAMAYAAHANGISDWAGSSRSHGLAKVIGELAEGISLQGTDPNGRPILSAEAQAMLDMLIAVVSGDSDVGIRPAGSKTEVLWNGDQAWQVFSELLLNREKAAARIYLGTDGTMGTTGGAPGVDISALFGVATTKVQGDLRAIEQGLAVGVYQPWTAINCGDSRYAPSLIYALPDPDAEQRSKQKADTYSRLSTTLLSMRSAGLVVTQDTVRELCTLFSVASVPVLGATGVPMPAAAPAPGAPPYPKA